MAYDVVRYYIRNDALGPYALYAHDVSANTFTNLGDTTSVGYGALYWSRADNVIYIVGRGNLGNNQNAVVPGGFDLYQNEPNGIAVASVNGSGTRTLVGQYSFTVPGLNSSVISINNIGQVGSKLVLFCSSFAGPGMGHVPVVLAVDVSNTTRPVLRANLSNIAISEGSRSSTRLQIKIGTYIYFFFYTQGPGNNPATGIWSSLAQNMRMPQAFALQGQGADDIVIRDVSYDGTYVFFASDTGLHAYEPAGQADPANWRYVGNLTSSLVPALSKGRSVVSYNGRTACTIDAGLNTGVYIFFFNGTTLSSSNGPIYSHSEIPGGSILYNRLHLQTTQDRLFQFWAPATHFYDAYTWSTGGLVIDGRDVRGTPPTPIVLPVDQSLDWSIIRN